MPRRRSTFKIVEIRIIRLINEIPLSQEDISTDVYFAHLRNKFKYFGLSEPLNRRNMTLNSYLYRIYMPACTNTFSNDYGM